jgi:hypothetical protein
VASGNAPTAPQSSPVPTRGGDPDVYVHELTGTFGTHAKKMQENDALLFGWMLHVSKQLSYQFMSMYRLAMHFFLPVTTMTHQGTDSTALHSSRVE